ncbi:MAG: site-specific integrase [Erysipelotrichales bacterium]|nr:site-specific integrase [Erysipelotrichales bacterium]
MARIENGEGSIIKRTGRKGVRYQCKIYVKDRSGKRKIISATANTQAEARRIAKSKKKLFLKQTGLGVRNAKVELEDTIAHSMGTFLKYYHNKKQWTSATLHSYTYCYRVVCEYIGYRKVKELSAHMLNDMFEELIAKYKKDSVRKMYSVMRSYVEYLASKAIISENIFLYVDKLPSKKRVMEVKQKDYKSKDSYKIFDEEEIRKLFLGERLYHDVDREYYRNIFYLMFLTGMRGQEVRALEISDIDFTHHTIRINKALSLKFENGESIPICKDPKNATSNRTIGVNYMVERVVKNILELRPNRDTNFLVVDKFGKWIKVGSFNYNFNELLKLYGIEKKDRSPHCLRHTFISFAIEKNEMSPLRNKEMLFVSRYVGHKNLSTTLNVYTHIAENKIKGVEYYSREDVLRVDYSKW